MTGAASAVRYLWARTFVNRLRSQAKRIRQPRYAVATAIGVLYMYFAVFRRGKSMENMGGPFGPLASSEFIVPLASAFLLFTTARWWIFGTDRSTLAFSPPEVQFLFPAPISRSGLVHAKLLRGQIAILFNTLLWSVMLRGNATSFGGWRRGVAMWLMFSTLSLHRLGAAIVRANALEHAKSGQRRSILPIVIFGAAFVAVAWGLLAARNTIAAASVEGIKATVHAVVVALSNPISSAALWPVRSLMAPVFAQTAPLWLTALPFSLLIFALHYLWVLRLDASFEEAALEASQYRAERMRSLRSAGQGTRNRAKSGKIARVPRLSLTGRPEVAIAWKNIVAALRSSGWRLQTLLFLVLLVVLAIISRISSERTADIFIGMCAAWGVMLLFIGPLGVRYDLRLDLPRLAMLKTYPISGARIVAAEIGGVTLLHSITIWTIMIVPVTLFIVDPKMFDNAAIIPVALLSVAFAVPALNLLMFTVHNGAALMFPSWVRVATEPRGFETMGQNLLTILATALTAAVALIFPLGLGFLVQWLGSSALGTWSLLVGALTASGLLALELWPVIFWLGSVFDRTDVNDVPTT